MDCGAPSCEGADVGGDIVLEEACPGAAGTGETPEAEGQGLPTLAVPLTRELWIGVGPRRAPSPTTDTLGRECCFDLSPCPLGSAALELSMGARGDGLDTPALGETWGEPPSPSGACATIEPEKLIQRVWP